MSSNVKPSPKEAPAMEEEADEIHLQKLKLRELEMLEECRLGKRESEISTAQLNEIARDLILMAEDKHKRALIRFDRLHALFWVSQKHKEEIFHKLQAKIASLEKKLSEKDEEIGKLAEDRDCLRIEMGEREGEISRLEREMKELEADFEIQLEELQLLRRLNEGLEEEKQELRKLEREKDNKVKELMKRNECLEMERGEIIGGNEYDEKIKELEKYVATWMLANLGRSDEKLGGTQVEQILSGIVKALDSEETGFTCNQGMKNDGNFQNAVEDGATCIDKVASSDVIHISDSDTDLETPVHGSGHKRKRASQSLSERENDGSSSDDSLNPKNKTKKLKVVLPEPVKPVAAMSGIRSNLKFVTPESQTKVVVRKCNEKLEKVKGSRCHDHDRSIPAEPDYSPEIEEYISSLSKKKH